MVIEQNRYFYQPLHPNEAKKKVNKRLIPIIVNQKLVSISLWVLLATVCRAQEPIEKCNIGQFVRKSFLSRGSTSTSQTQKKMGYKCRHAFFFLIFIARCTDRDGAK